MKILSKPTPKLRFKTSDGSYYPDWQEYKIGDLFKINAGGDVDRAKLSKIQNEEYPYPIYSNSDTDKGLYGYTNTFKQEGGCVTVTGRGALGLAVARYEPFYPIVRLLVLRPKERSKTDVTFSEYLINTTRFFVESTGVPQLTSPQISTYKVITPSIEEQKKIANFLSIVDNKINLLEKKEDSFQEYKKGLVQQIFSQSMRFRDANCNAHSNWRAIQLSEVLEVSPRRNSGLETDEIFSVAKNAGIVNQIEHLGRSYAGKDISIYKVVSPQDIVYTKSPTRDFPYGIVKQNHTDREGLVSVLYGVYKPKNLHIGYILHEYFNLWVNTYNYLNPIIHKGAKNTINISDEGFLNGSMISLPVDYEEQAKIAELLDIVNSKINLLNKQIELHKEWKKGLLQQMFVS